jgi:hypothetical protein
LHVDDAVEGGQAESPANATASNDIGDVDSAG